MQSCLLLYLFPTRSALSCRWVCAVVRVCWSGCCLKYMGDITPVSYAALSVVWDSSLHLKVAFKFTARVKQVSLMMLDMV